MNSKTKPDLQELLDLAEIVSNDLFDCQNKLDLIRQKVMTLNRLVATVKKDQQTVDIL